MILARTTLAKIFTGVALILTTPLQASAADWQYCLSPSSASHKVYMSNAFPARGVPYDADDVFEHILNAAGLRHDVVQCPRADDQPSIVAMQQYATVFNREIGNVVVRVPLDWTRWR